jgi:nucleoside phosphorylase
VINIGIAGSLDSSIQLNQIYGIRSVHHEHYGVKGYPSFQCMETHSRFDCVSAARRVDNDIYAKSLEKIAPIVDRELWAIGSVCNHFNLPFKSYKLISDFAGKSTDDQQIKSRAISFSKHLFDFYKNLSLTKADWNSSD